MKVAGKVAAVVIGIALLVAIGFATVALVRQFGLLSEESILCLYQLLRHP
jgi:hypothetical protein